MAKPLPRVDGGEQPRKEKQEPQTMATLTADERIEPMPVIEGYIPRNVDVRMTKVQARILKDKQRQLQDSGATTADGKPVDNRAQTVRWIIENLVK
jgi:hypothetical protein